MQTFDEFVPERASRLSGWHCSEKQKSQDRHDSPIDCEYAERNSPTRQNCAAKNDVGWKTCRRREERARRKRVTGMRAKT